MLPLTRCGHPPPSISYMGSRVPKFCICVGQTISPTENWTSPSRRFVSVHLVHILCECLMVHIISYPCSGFAPMYVPPCIPIIRNHFHALSSQVYSADECFVTGIFAGLIPVRVVDGRLIGRGGMLGPISATLQRLYMDLMHEYSSSGRRDLRDKGPLDLVKDHQ